MRYSWRAFSLFGSGVLFGLVASAVLFAPPELESQPPPWAHPARAQAPGTAVPQVASAGLATTADPLSAPRPVAAAPDPAATLPLPAAVEQAAVSAQATPALAAVAVAEVTPALPAAQVITTSTTTPVAKKRKVQSGEPAADTSALGAGPAAYPVSVAPEPVRQPPEEALPRSEPEAFDPSR